MEITIKSDILFVESYYDAAFGLAKSMIIQGDRGTIASQRKGFVLTATLNVRKQYCNVKIHKKAPINEA